MCVCVCVCVCAHIFIKACLCVCVCVHIFLIVFVDMFVKNQSLSYYILQCTYCRFLSWKLDLCHLLVNWEISGRRIL